MGHTHSVTDYPGHIAGIAAISATIGAIAALFVTPRSGDQVRAGIKRRAGHMHSSMKDTGEQMSETIATKKDDIKDTANKIKDDAKQTAKETKEK
jgi:gas vesicle protein